MSTLWNNPAAMRCCSVADNFPTSVVKQVLLAELNAKIQECTLIDNDNPVAGKVYIGVETWSIQVGFTCIARYRSREAAERAYQEATEATRRGDRVFDMPTAEIVLTSQERKGTKP